MRPALLLTLALAIAGCLDGPLRPGERHVDGRVAQLEGIHGTGTDLVRIVVHAHPGREPVQATRDAVVSQFAALADKPVELEVRVEASPFPDDHVWTSEDRAPLTAAALAEPWPPGVALVHLFSVPGCVAYNATRPCIGGISGSVAWVMTDAAEGDVLGDEARNPALRDVPFVGWYTKERYLYVHELGHVFGLAGTIAPDSPRLSREDCFCHNTERASVMYRFQTGPGVPAGPELVEVLQEDNVVNYQFSAADLEDARRYRDGLGEHAEA